MNWNQNVYFLDLHSILFACLFSFDLSISFFVADSCLFSFDLLILSVLLFDLLMFWWLFVCLFVWPLGSAWSALVLFACRPRQRRVNFHLLSIHLLSICFATLCCFLANTDVINEIIRIRSILASFCLCFVCCSIEQIHGIGKINAFEKQKLAEMQVRIVWLKLIDWIQMFWMLIAHASTSCVGFCRLSSRAASRKASSSPRTTRCNFGAASM